MLNILFLRQFSLVSYFMVLPMAAQVLQTPAIAANNVPIETPAARSATDGAINTRKDARTITLKIPAPRGEIVDREGEPFAQNRVAYQVALQFKQFENADRDFVINWTLRKSASFDSAALIESSLSFGLATRITAWPAATTWPASAITCVTTPSISATSVE